MVIPSTWEEDYPWLHPVRGRITHGYTQYVGGGLPMVIPSTWEEDYPWLYPVRGRRITHGYTEYGALKVM